VRTTDLLELVADSKRSEEHKAIEEVEKIKSKSQKGDSNRMSLQLFKEGKNISEIAGIRGLAQSTIESHLISFIKTGEIDVKEIVDENKIGIILQAMEELNMQTTATTPVKTKLGDAFSHSEIRAVFYYRDWLQVSKVAH
jgi:uncharacterized protein YpbB